MIILSSIIDGNWFFFSLCSKICLYYIKIYFFYYKIYSSSIPNFPFLLTFAFQWINTVLSSKLLAQIPQSFYLISRLCFSISQNPKQNFKFTNALLYSLTAMFHKYSGTHLARFIMNLINYILFSLISLSNSDRTCWDGLTF